MRAKTLRFVVPLEMFYKRQAHCTSVHLAQIALFAACRFSQLEPYAGLLLWFGLSGDPDPCL